MSLAWSSVKALSIPVGGTARDVKRVTAGGVVLWEKPNPVPYDAEVEYLETDGKAYIDTDVAISPDIGIEMEFYIPEHTTGNYFLGNIPNWSTDRFMMGFFTYSSGVIRFDAYTTDNRDFAKNIGIWQTLKFGNGSITVNGVTKTYTKDKITTVAKLRFFGISGTGGYAGLRIKSCKVLVGGTVVRDFTPVRVGSGSSAVGYLYDRANPTGGPLGNGLYGNSGTGAFVVGPDANA